MEEQFAPSLSAMALAERVEKLVKREGMKYTEAIIEICAELSIEPIDIAKIIIASPLQNKLELEGRKYNYFRVRSRKGNRSHALKSLTQNTASLL